MIKGKAYTKSTTKTQTIPQNRKSPKKHSSHRSPIRPPTPKLGNLEKAYISNPKLINETKLECSLQSKMDHALSSRQE